MLQTRKPTESDDGIDSRSSFWWTRVSGCSFEARKFDWRTNADELLGRSVDPYPLCNSEKGIATTRGASQIAKFRVKAIRGTRWQATVSLSNRIQQTGYEPPTQQTTDFLL